MWRYVSFAIHARAHGFATCAHRRLCVFIILLSYYLDYSLSIILLSLVYYFIIETLLCSCCQIFNQLNVDEHGANEVSRVVHEYSTVAANRELLAALRNQRDVVM
eukprot:SAG31_NODE_23428_length_504_cov_1.390123_2_plen_104_part_01